MSGFRQCKVPGLGKAVCPFEMKDFRGKATGSFYRLIRASGVGDDDFIDHGSDTAESVLDPIFFILNDHAERNTHDAHNQSTWRAIEKWGMWGQTTRSPTPGNFCLMVGSSFPDKVAVDSL